MRRRTGFTLVELAVVMGLALALIGMLVCLCGRTSGDTLAGLRRYGAVQHRLAARRQRERDPERYAARSRLFAVYRPVIAPRPEHSGHEQAHGDPR